LAHYNLKFQALRSLSGATRGEGWRDVPDDRRGNWFSVVRFVIRDVAFGRFLHAGPGVIIGNIEGNWLIIATASHVIERIDELLVRDGQPLPGPQEGESPDAYLRRRLDAIAGLTHCIITGPGGEGAFKVANFEVAKVRKRRDTALAFVALPFQTPITCLPISLDRPPSSDEPVLVVGAVDSVESIALTHSKDSEQNIAPARKLVVRESFLDGFGMHPDDAPQFDYDVVKILVRLENGMSGGPLVDRFQSNFWGLPPFYETRALIAINSGSGPGLGSGGFVWRSFATPVIALYAQNVALPSGEWISFSEAVARGYVATVGGEPHCVHTSPNGRLEVDHRRMATMTLNGADVPLQMEPP
jgi:hypothetical protein